MSLVNQQDLTAAYLAIGKMIEKARDGQQAAGSEFPDHIRAENCCKQIVEIGEKALGVDTNPDTRYRVVP